MIWGRTHCWWVLNNEGKTIILITHDPNIAKMTQRTIRIVNGEIAPPTSPTE